MTRATALVLAGGLGLTALFIALPKNDVTDGRPYVPTSPDAVLERVPRGLPRPTPAADPQAAAAQARALIEQARANGGDPRLLGRAQAVLAPWWSSADAPPAVLLLRATVKQSLHDFDGALADLDALVALTPGDPQAWLTRATVLGVQARYDDALASCDRLAGLTDATVMRVCRAPLLGVQGKTTEALQSLEAPVDGSLQAWVDSTRGELLRWQGRLDAAEAMLRQALARAPDDTYTRLVLADVLLDLKRPQDAAALFDGRTLNDTELLLQVLALEAAGDARAPAARADLDARVAANRQREETLHRREESRYALQLERDAVKALALAKANWALQKEPADARVLLEAARAAGDVAAARPALEWLDRTGFEDPVLRGLR